MVSICRVPLRRLFRGCCLSVCAVSSQEIEDELRAGQSSRLYGRSVATESTRRGRSNLEKSDNKSRSYKIFTPKWGPPVTLACFVSSCCSSWGCNCRSWPMQVARPVEYHQSRLSLKASGASRSLQTSPPLHIRCSRKAIGECTESSPQRRLQIDTQIDKIRRPNASVFLIILFGPDGLEWTVVMRKLGLRKQKCY